jgi:phosphoserine aminotransferase
MISFYPGPSRVYDEIPAYVKDAANAGILSMNHRSDACMELIKKTLALLRKKLSIPANYTIVFAGSATECWEIIAQSFNQKSIHFYNGAFGKKWYEYTKKIKPSVQSVSFLPEHALEPQAFPYTDSTDLLCFTQNETSNGTQVSVKILEQFRKRVPEALIAVDATSSLAGIYLNIKAADIWFASVQKCFGLPAGLSLIICSPKAIQRMREVNRYDHYNSLAFMVDMMNRHQTPYTPNVLGIYLLMRVLQKVKPIKEIEKITQQRFDRWSAFFNEHTFLKFFITNRNMRSKTVIALTGEPAYLDSLKKKAKKKGFLLGEGYGDLKTSTLRIANFPAIKQNEITALQKFLRSN